MEGVMVVQMVVSLASSSLKRTFLGCVNSIACGSRENEGSKSSIHSINEAYQPLASLNFASMYILVPLCGLLDYQHLQSGHFQKLGDIMEMAFGGRYVVMLMAPFSIYSGFVIFGHSAYACRDSSRRDAPTAGLIKVRGTYPFGVDYKWHGTRSELPFLNSLKMKVSILLGVAQMNLGIILSYSNASFSRMI